MYGSSRLGRVLPAAVNGSATGFTTRFGTETYQVRVETGQAVWARIFDSTNATTDFKAGSSSSTSTSSSTSAAEFTNYNGTYLPANEWDYWTVTPGQFLCWKSTSTSTNAWISVTEMS